MDPHSPKKLFATKYCFLILGDEFLFLNHFFISRFLFFLFYVILLFLIFTKTVLLLSFFLIFFFMKITFIFSCSGMSRHVPECSGIFHVPDFIDALLYIPKSYLWTKMKEIDFSTLATKWRCWSIFLFSTSQARNWGNKIQDLIHLWIFNNHSTRARWIWDDR